MSKERKATIKSSDAKVSVYKSKLRNTWINSSDCTTEYKESELDFKN